MLTTRSGSLPTCGSKWTTFQNLGPTRRNSILFIVGWWLDHSQMCLDSSTRLLQISILYVHSPLLILDILGARNSRGTFLELSASKVSIKSWASMITGRNFGNGRLCLPNRNQRGSVARGLGAFEMGKSRHRSSWENRSSVRCCGIVQGPDDRSWFRQRCWD
jgi:hypothetical protein